jgi:hypothetical protein
MRRGSPTGADGAASAGIALSVAMFAMAATSGIQALLYLDAFGIGGRTDGFFVAFGLYVTFGVFSQSIRVTAAPLLVGRRARLGPRQLAAVMALIALPVAILTIPLAGPLADVLAPGLSAADREVTQDALPLLGGAMVLQLWAAGGATMLAVRDRFAAVARAYTLGAVAGLAVYLAVESAAGELSLAWSMLGMAIVTCGVMLAAAAVSSPIAPERTDASVSVREVVRGTVLVLGRTGVYLAFHGLYVITVAFVSRADPGDATVLSYAYIFASYLNSGTGVALGMGRIADMRRATITDRAQALAETVVPGYRYSMLLVAPALAALVTFVPSLVGELLPQSLGGADVDNLREFGALLVAWTLAALMVNLLLPAMFALGKARLLNALAPVLVLLQLGATATGSALFGAAGAVGAFWVAPACFAVALAVLGAGRGALPLARAVALDTVRLGGLAALAFGASMALGAAMGGDARGVVVAAVVGTALYGAGLCVVARQQLGFVADSVLPRRGRVRAPGTAPAVGAPAIERQ